LQLLVVVVLLSAYVLNHTKLTNPISRQRGIDFAHRTWSLRNHFWKVKVHLLQVRTDGALPNQLSVNVISDRP